MFKNWKNTRRTLEQSQTPPEPLLPKEDDPEAGMQTEQKTVDSDGYRLVGDGLEDACSSPYDREYAIDSYSSRCNSKNRNKFLLWCMLAILVSNPLLGLYLIRNFWNLNSTQDTLVKLGNHVGRYAFYSVFGEVIFAVTCLVILCTSSHCCTNARQRTQYMIPCIALSYAVIYKILSLYILVVGVYLLVQCSKIAYPGFLGNMQNITQAEMDIHKAAFKVAFWFCLENIYITLADSCEFIAAVVKMIWRACKGQGIEHDLAVAEQAAEADQGKFYNSVVFFDTLLNNRDSYQEGLFSDIYSKYMGDLGTYLDNIDIRQYTEGIERLGQLIPTPVG
ncbi:hypothetical protein BdWA1_002882 [Babesia duncani]|uniref:Uncharacterized protein n=1 Tax=Babesia duncani TaxID=323732 RepID=A0AAD9PHZ6_9APIC|nr:hypothetical protein BdWA1_002882 [Babesia duncani]